MVSADGGRVRVAPEFAAEFVPADGGDPPFYAEDAMPGKVLATPMFDAGEANVADEAGWVRVATFQADGTCREDSALLELREPGCYPLRVRVRGLTGAATVSPGPAGGTVP